MLLRKRCRRTWRTSSLKSLTVYCELSRSCKRRTPAGQTLALMWWGVGGDHTYRQEQEGAKEPPVEEREGRGISVGHELFSDASLLPSSVTSLLSPSPGTFSTRRRALPPGLRCQMRKSNRSEKMSLISLLPLSSLYFCLTFSISLQFSQVLLLHSVSE